MSYFSNLFKITTKKAIKAQSDEALLQEFTKGSRLAFDELVLRYKNKIFNFIFHQLKQQHEEAEDLTQEVFISLFKKGKDFREDAKFSSYLFAIARNTVLNYFRAKGRRVDMLESIDGMEFEDNTNLEADLIARNKQALYVRAFNELNTEEQQILYLVDKENFRYSQIADILNIKTGTVRSRLNSARTKLIAQLRDLSREQERRS